MQYRHERQWELLWASFRLRLGPRLGGRFPFLDFDAGIADDQMWYVQMAKEQSRQADLHLERGGFSLILSGGITNHEIIYGEGRSQGSGDMDITPVQDPDVRR